MDFHQLLRSFFGLRARWDPRFEVPDQRDEGDPFGMHVFPGLPPFSGRPSDEPWGAADHSEGAYLAPGEPYAPFLGARDGGDHPRDWMLKVPDEPLLGAAVPRPDEVLDVLRDTDLDEHVASVGLDGLLPPARHEIWGSTTVHTFSSADGKLEERKVVTDARGNREVTVRRAVGDRSHTLRTRVDASGSRETEEQLVNLDEGDKATFDRLWNAPSPAVPAPGTGDPSPGTALGRLFGFWGRR